MSFWSQHPKTQMILTNALQRQWGPYRIPSETKMLSLRREQTGPSNQTLKPSHPSPFSAEPEKMSPQLTQVEDPSLVKNKTHKQETFKPLLTTMLIKA